MPRNGSNDGRCRPVAARLFLCVSIALAAACGQSVDTAYPPEAVAANNRGVGLMGSFNYAEAEAAFAETLELAPGWDDARVNLAIATLNQERDGEALAILK